MRAHEPDEALPVEPRSSANLAIGKFVGIAGASILAVALVRSDFNRAGSSRVSLEANAAPHTISVPAELTFGAFQVLPAPMGVERPFLVNGMMMSESDRKRLRQQLKEGRVRIAVVKCWDTFDEDDDQVLITSAGFSQTVSIRHVEKSFFIPVVPGGVVRIQALKDGGGGNVTLGMSTILGPVTLSPLFPGQSVEVPAL